ncbi:hypothetical protein [Stenotrophomonas oahuensis]|uniref:Uncharacterized protein n=1 Tax=Stenotrophomonas oahuensis TaxID=3003271 RepID=A0ABY9YV05_9GAMM|nr:hypothetical protein [Stenotrophomonas sp. A5586]WNH54498.1 hypothetical protein PDM29_09550 [Stenotrophomonas sp. A5586]
MAQWQFRALNPNENSGSSISDDNFSIEERTNVEILVRETLQNPLDARASSDDTVRVSYRIVEIDADAGQTVRSLFSEGWLSHARAGQLLTDKLAPVLRFLLIEDFGTTGLEGAYTDSSVDGESENWNAFWFREGEGAKHARANGGAGQGKITLYLASKVRTVVALTNRLSDGRALLFGCSRFPRNYRLGDEKTRWAKEARWGRESDQQSLAVPISDASFIESIKSELGLRRGDAPGTSFIVPLPLDNLTEQDIKTAVINEFFFAICRGRLEVEVGGALLEKSTIVSEADGLPDGGRVSQDYRQFLQAAAERSGLVPLANAKATWVKGMDSASFDEGDLFNLTHGFELGQPVSVDFPLTIKAKRGATYATKFRVHLQLADSLDRSEELFVRQDLAIDGEKKLRSVRSGDPVMALTFIDDPRLSDLLVCAEEPTHRTWNAQRPKVKNAYQAPGAALSAVRNAAAKLVQLLAPAGQRDETALAAYFADPAHLLELKKGARGKKEGSKPGPPPVDEVPVAKPKPVVVTPQRDGFTVSVSPNQDGGFQRLECSVELAYATVRGDPFRQWDSADFWLEDASAFPIELTGVSNLRREGNRLRFDMDREGAALAVRGFDHERQLEIRLKYTEVADEADITSY